MSLALRSLALELNYDVAPPAEPAGRAVRVVVAPPPIARWEQRIPVRLPGPRRLGDTDARTAPEIVPPIQAARTTQRPINRGRVLLPPPRRLGDTDPRLTKRLDLIAQPPRQRSTDRRQPWLPGGAIEAVGEADERTFPATILRAADATARLALRLPVLIGRNPKEPGLATDRPPRPILLAARVPTRRPADRRQPIINHHVVETPIPPTDGTWPALLVRAPDAIARRALRLPVRFGRPARLGDTDARTAPALKLVSAPPPRQRFADRRPVSLPGAAIEAVGVGDERTRPSLLVRAADAVARWALRLPVFAPATTTATGVADERTRPARVLVAPPPVARDAIRVPVRLGRNPKEPGLAADRPPRVAQIVVRPATKRPADRRQPLFLSGARKDTVAPQTRAWTPLIILSPPQPQRAERRQPSLSPPRRLGESDRRTAPLVRLVIGKVDPQRFDRHQPAIPTPRRRGDTDERLTHGPWLVIAPARDKPASERRPVLLLPPRRRGETDDRTAPLVRLLVAPQPTRQRINRGVLWFARAPLSPVTPGMLTGTIVLESALAGTLLIEAVVSGEFDVIPVLSGTLEVTLMQTIFEGDTLRVKLSDLTHDKDGVLTTGATVTVTVYRADGTVINSGSATYDAGLGGWVRSVTVPALSAPERIRTKAVAVYTGGDNSQKTFETGVTARASLG